MEWQIGHYKDSCKRWMIYQVKKDQYDNPYELFIHTGGRVFVLTLWY